MTEIRVPIMALVDYRGFRLIALSVLPVSGKSLVRFFLSFFFSFSPFSFLLSPPISLFKKKKY